jgi:hypothetical protein
VENCVSILSGRLKKCLFTYKSGTSATLNDGPDKVVKSDLPLEVQQCANDIDY